VGRPIKKSEQGQGLDDCVSEGRNFNKSKEKRNLKRVAAEYSKGGRKPGKQRRTFRVVTADVRGRSGALQSAIAN